MNLCNNIFFFFWDLICLLIFFHFLFLSLVCLTRMWCWHIFIFLFFHFVSFFSVLLIYFLTTRTTKTTTTSIFCIVKISRDNWHWNSGKDFFLPIFFLAENREKYEFAVRVSNDIFHFSFKIHIKHLSDNDRIWTWSLSDEYWYGFKF